MTAIFNASSDVAVRKYTIQILRLTWSFFHPGGALAIIRSYTCAAQYGDFDNILP